MLILGVVDPGAREVWRHDVRDQDLRRGWHRRMEERPVRQAPVHHRALSLGRFLSCIHNFEKKNI